MGKGVGKYAFAHYRQQGLHPSLVLLFVMLFDKYLRLFGKRRLLKLPD
jgi:hypothetical protein